MCDHPAIDTDDEILDDSETSVEKFSLDCAAGEEAIYSFELKREDITDF